MLLWNDGYRTWSENSLLSWLWYRNHINWLLIGYWNHVTRNLAVENTHPRLVLWYPTKLNRKHFSEKRYLILRTSLQLIIVPPSGLSIGPWQVLKTDPAIIVSNYHPALEISIDQHFIELRKARRMLCSCTVCLKYSRVTKSVLTFVGVSPTHVRVKVSLRQPVVNYLIFFGNSIYIILKSLVQWVSLWYIIDSLYLYYFRICPTHKLSL